MNEPTVAEYLARTLQKEGVSHAFELIGGMITVLIDALHKYSDIKVVSVHHEQGAGFAVDGFGRMSPSLAVAFATSGPGATNLLTAIGSCYFDSVPSLFITGQVNRHEMRGDRAIRQLGFQETDIVSMAKPITKAALQAPDAESFPALLHHAITLARSGRPGPVLLDIPMDVQRTMIPMGSLTLENRANPTADSEPLRQFGVSIARHLNEAKRPLFLVGGGLRSGRAVDLFRELTKKWPVPVVHSLMAVDALPFGHPLRAGLIGSYGNRWANHALSQADTLIVLGSRLDVRQTGADTASFKGQRHVFHVDCEPGELNNRVMGCEVLVSELLPFFNALDDLPALKGNYSDWQREIGAWRAEWPDTAENDLPGSINPNVAIREICAACPTASAMVTDVGQHQMWAAQSATLTVHQQFLTSGGMGSMGYALPAALGVAFAAPGKPVIVIAGDGGFQCNIQELQTVARNRLPLKMIVLNNRCHGMVRQFQQSYFDERYHSTLWGYSAPSFAKVADAYGISSGCVADPSELRAAMLKACADPSEPYLLEVEISPEVNAYPKMAFGRAFGEMEPAVKPLDMEGT